MHDLIDRDRIRAHHHRIAREPAHGHAAPVDFGLQQVQGLAHAGSEVERLARRRVGWRFEAAPQTRQHLGRAARLRAGAAHGLARGVQRGWLIGQQALRGLCAGQHGGQWLVQLVCQASRELAHGVEPAELAKAQQGLGALACLAQAQRVRQQGQAGQHGQHPRGHAQPGQFAPADPARGHHVKGLAFGGHHLVEVEAPAAIERAARL